MVAGGSSEMRMVTLVWHRPQVERRDEGENTPREWIVETRSKMTRMPEERMKMAGDTMEERKTQKKLC